MYRVWMKEGIEPGIKAKTYRQEGIPPWIVLLDEEKKRERKEEDRGRREMRGMIYFSRSWASHRWAYMQSAWR